MLVLSRARFVTDKTTSRPRPIPRQRIGYGECVLLYLGGKLHSDLSMMTFFSCPLSVLDFTVWYQAYYY